MAFHTPEKWRIVRGQMATDANHGNNGLFILPAIPPKRPLVLQCFATDGSEWARLGFTPPAWEHVSVSTLVRCPTWDEMCLIKTLFWDPEDVVIQLHPRQSEYVNNHPRCLHLWRPIGVDLPTPPSRAVGYVLAPESRERAAELLGVVL